MNAWGTTHRLLDVAIAGGGPGGATLAAFLGRDTDLSVAVFEKAFFPREHIGESFSPSTTAALEESGALEKVIDSGCSIKKFGGYYAWGNQDPAVSLFEHQEWMKDGILRWAVHANRSEFDRILLDHAAKSGAEVHEGVAVEGVCRRKNVSLLKLSDGTAVRARLVVDATGGVADLFGQKKTRLCPYEDIAIWSHFAGGRLAQSLDAPWNLFRELGVSASAHVAFEDGWFWCIPVRRKVLGQRQWVHSVGMVTDPRVLQQPGKRYTDPNVFLQKARETPILRELMEDSSPISDGVMRATKRSSTSEDLCSYDDGWISIGDAAFFVDPLFSTGVSFAVSQAAGAALAVRSKFSQGLSGADKRELWHDYNIGWRNIAGRLSLVMAQWYHRVAEHHPSSVYWRSRAAPKDPKTRRDTINALVEPTFSSDLVFVLSRGAGQVEALGKTGPLIEALRELKRKISPQALLSLKKSVRWRESMTLQVGISRSAHAVHHYGEEEGKNRLKRYWADPVQNGHLIPRLHDRPHPCHRVYFEGATRAPEFIFLEARDRALPLLERLRTEWVEYGALWERADSAQRAFLAKLLRANMLDTRDPSVES